MVSISQQYFREGNMSISIIWREPGRLVYYHLCVLFLSLLAIGSLNVYCCCFILAAVYLAERWEDSRGASQESKHGGSTKRRPCFCRKRRRRHHLVRGRCEQAGQYVRKRHGLDQESPPGVAPEPWLPHRHNKNMKNKRKWNKIEMTKSKICGD